MYHPPQLPEDPRRARRGACIAARFARRSVFASASRRAIPSPDGVVLWTRLAGRPRPACAVPVRWEVAADEAMKSIVFSGDSHADAGVGAFGPRRGARASRPSAGTGIASRGGDAQSPIGRTRTAPAAERRRRAPALRLRLLPAVRAGLLRRLPPHRRRRAGPGRVPRRLHLRIDLGPRPRAQARRAGAVHARRLPRALRALQERPRPAGGARRLPVDRHLGRPRGGQRLRRRPSRGRHGARRRSSRAAPPPTRPTTSTCRCRARMRPKGRDMRIHTQLDWGSLARFHILDTRQYRS